MTRRRRLSILALLALLAGCAEAPPPAPVAAAPAPPPVTVAAAPPEAQFIRVPLRSRGGTHIVMVGISGVCCFPFLIDSGASDVSVSPDIFKAMVHDGIIGRDDLIDVQTYRTAAGGTVEGLRFRIPELNIGGLTVRNVLGSVTPGTNMLLLGQSFLRKFRFWAIDNRTGELVLG